MAAADYAGAVRAGTMAAARLHHDLQIRAVVEQTGGMIDIFGTIQLLELPLLLRPLQGLLGAYMSDPTPGVLVTTQRPLAIQRFTAAHELGHYVMGHRPSLDDESILRRMPLPTGPAQDFQEVEADAFAVAFMMPRWIIQWHAARQGWTTIDFRRPELVYQLALRLGASYEATCWTLVRHNIITAGIARNLQETAPRELKVRLLSGYTPENYRGDVWLLTERDAGTRIDGSHNDVFVLNLREHSGGGFLWNVDQLAASGFAVVDDRARSSDGEGVGGPTTRWVTATPENGFRGILELDERRPWAPEPPLNRLRLDYDLTGPEPEGLSRAERRSLLKAA